METNNDRLIVRTLARRSAAEPGAELTRRIMERIAEEPAHAERRENRMLFIGALLCVLGVVLLGICVFRFFPEIGTGVFTGETFGGLRANTARLLSEMKPSSPDNPAASGGYPLVLWCYTAVLFLLFLFAGEWMRRERSGLNRK